MKDVGHKFYGINTKEAHSWYGKYIMQNRNMAKEENLLNSNEYNVKIREKKNWAIKLNMAMKHVNYFLFALPKSFCKNIHKLKKKYSDISSVITSLST